jgi:hypothetical protein
LLLLAPSVYVEAAASTQCWSRLNKWQASFTPARARAGAGTGGEDQHRTFAVCALQEPDQPLLMPGCPSDDLRVVGKRVSRRQAR